MATTAVRMVVSANCFDDAFLVGRLLVLVAVLLLLVMVIASPLRWRFFGRAMLLPAAIVCGSWCCLAVLVVASGADIVVVRVVSGDIIS